MHEDTPNSHIHFVFNPVGYIRDALEPEIAHWHYIDPVFIDAGTGKGKSTFDIEVLIPRAQRLGKIVTVRELIVKAVGATGFVEPQPTRVATLGREALNNRLDKFSCPYRFEKNIWKINKEE